MRKVEKRKGIERGVKFRDKKIRDGLIIEKIEVGERKEKKREGEEKIKGGGSEK